MGTHHDIAVSVRGLSKSYTIAHNSVRHDRLAEAFMDGIRNFGRKPETETFWALKDVSFDINKGDVVGIIGRNGAGKSTLLKVLSRITEPTSGQIELYGRVGSLLEVGTGFHPELTGRENVYLNGAVLGMSRREIAKHFDAIVDFAGVEKFLDTPVKRYSSGMYVRLAFAVAAHLEPEILIVDEVLAVGDVEFQKKCLGKMQDVAAHGRTVLFVSHQIASVQKLCNQLILLKQGQLIHHGSVNEGVIAYMNETSLSNGLEAIDLRLHNNRTGDGPVRFAECQILHDRPIGHFATGEFQIGEKIGVSLKLHSEAAVADVLVGYAISDINGTVLFTSHHNDTSNVCNIPAGDTVFQSWINPNYLQPGRYIIQAGVLVRGQNSDFISEIAQIEVASVLGATGSELDSRPGLMRINFPWEVFPHDQQFTKAQEQELVSGGIL